MKTPCRWLERRARLVAVVGCAGLVTLPLAAQATAQARPARAVSFTLFVNSQSVGIFQEVTGLAPPEELSAQEAEARRPVARAARPQGRLVTLRGCNTQCARYLQIWRKEVMEGRSASARRTAMIVAGDAARRETLRYTLTGAWPERLSLGSLAPNSSVPDVTLVLAYEALRVDHGP